MTNKGALLFFLAAALALACGGCMIDDPDFKVNSKDAIIASKREVIVTPEATQHGKQQNVKE